MSALHSVDLVLFTSKAPRAVAQLASRIHQEVPDAQVCGILYQSPLRDGVLPQDLATRLRRRVADLFESLGSAILRFVHACPGRPSGSTRFGLGELSRSCEALGCSLFLTSQLSTAESQEFVRMLHSDRGIVYGTQGVAPELFALPREGSLVLRKGRVLDCGDTAPPGYEELLCGQQQINIHVHRFEAAFDEGAAAESAVIPIEAYDTLTSLALKTNLIGDDLLIQTITKYVKGEVQDRPLGHSIEPLPTLEPHALASHQKQIARLSPSYKPPRSRPIWNLLLRTLVSAPWLVSRNWFRRWRGSAPVMILFHHLVTDRPHHLGIPTDLFFKHVKFLKRHYRVASLSEAIEALQSKRLKVPTVVLTLDDGYQENFINLRAVATEAGIPAALFVCTKHISQQHEFEHDQKHQQHDFPPLTWKQIEYLGGNGFEIGSHTRSHFDCGSTDVSALTHEILGSKADLEERLGHPVKYFSFPWGQPANMSPEAIRLAKATYPYTFSAHGGANFPSRNRSPWHLLRQSHLNDLWELELELQSVLDR